MDAPKPPPPAGQPRIYERGFRIRLQHVDAAGVVFFARYFELAHEVYEAFLEDLGHSIAAAIETGDVIIPIGSATARYIRPLRHGESITARLHLKELRGSSFVVSTTFFGPDGNLRAVLTTGHVCVNPATFRPVALPPDLKAVLADYVDSGEKEPAEPSGD